MGNNRSCNYDNWNSNIALCRVQTIRYRTPVVPNKACIELLTIASTRTAQRCALCSAVIGSRFREAIDDHEAWILCRHDHAARRFQNAHDSCSFEATPMISTPCTNHGTSPQTITTGSRKKNNAIAKRPKRRCGMP